ncbi:MAG: hypothetical protein IKP96_01305 [Elusimicrobiaceae bacterium]|nr:hypothetical protein [Elusimicrobiaceae bacterium]
MKKIIVLACLWMGGGFLHATSTCETRVDRHPKATTVQRVNYCLTPDESVEESARGPEVIYYDVTIKEPIADPSYTNQARKQVYFDERSMEVARNYVGSTRFPEFKNDISAQPRINKGGTVPEEVPVDTVFSMPQPDSYPETTVTTATVANQPKTVTTRVTTVQKTVSYSDPELASSSSFYTSPKDLTYTEFIEKQATSGYHASQASMFAQDYAAPQKQTLDTVVVTHERY